MMNLYTYVVSRLKSEKGQGIVEYALLLAFVVAIAGVALSTDNGLGDAISNVFENTAQELNNSTGANQGGAGTGTGN
ncbi:MAG: Flp family type IVb pilin [Selenomonadaceae bacterium]